MVRIGGGDGCSNGLTPSLSGPKPRLHDVLCRKSPADAGLRDRPAATGRRAGGCRVGSTTELPPRCAAAGGGCGWRKLQSAPGGTDAALRRAGRPPSLAIVDGIVIETLLAQTNVSSDRADQ